MMDVVACVYLVGLAVCAALFALPMVYGTLEDSGMTAPQAFKGWLVCSILWPATVARVVGAVVRELKGEE